jgi:hypothetical protein
MKSVPLWESAARAAGTDTMPPNACPPPADRGQSGAETGDRGDLRAFFQCSLLLCIQLDGEGGDIFFEMGDRTGARNQDRLGRAGSQPGQGHLGGGGVVPLCNGGEWPDLASQAAHGEGEEEHERDALLAAILQGVLVAPVDQVIEILDRGDGYQLLGSGELLQGDAAQADMPYFPGLAQFDGVALLEYLKQRQIVQVQENSRCAGYLGNPFQNQEVNSRVGNLTTTSLMRRLPRKRTGRAIMSALFWNGFPK